MGFLAQGSLAGDKICLFQGSQMPFVVKKVKGGYRLLRDAYVRGMMGEDSKPFMEAPISDITLI